MKFNIDEYISDVLIEVSSGLKDAVPSALRSGFHEIYRIEPSAELYPVVYDAIKVELERQPCSTKVMLYSGPTAAALNQACENSQNKFITVHLKSGRSGSGLLEEIQILRHWFSNNILHPIVIATGLGKDLAPLPITDLMDALLDLCDRYHFQILDDSADRNVLAAVPPAWLLASVGGLVACSSGDHSTNALPGRY